MTTSRRSADRRRRERGSALVELTLLVGVILVITIGVFEFGRGFHTYASVIQAAREGARAALDGTKTDAQIQAIAVTAASPVSVTITVTHSSGQTTVAASASFTSSVPIISAIWGGGALTMSRAFTVQ
jgi:Flp pilus assembly protein TadG